MIREIILLAVVSVFLFSSCEKESDSVDIPEPVLFERFVYSEPEHILKEKDVFDENGIQISKTIYEELGDTLVIKEIIEYELDNNYVINTMNYFFNVNEPKSFETFNNIYNNSGLLIESISNKPYNGLRITYEYDEFNRLKTYAYYYSIDEALVINYLYDTDGNLDSALWSSNKGDKWEVINYQCDDNKVIKEESYFNAVKQYEVNYKYHSNNTVSERIITYSSSNIRIDKYDELGRITYYAHSDILVETYEYSDESFTPILSVHPRNFNTYLFNIYR